MIEKVELFDRSSMLTFSIVILTVFLFSLLIEYHNYTKMLEFTTFKSEATVISQTLKSKHSKNYYILKLKLTNGKTAYVKESAYIRGLVGRKVGVTLFIKSLSFYAFMRGTFYNAHIFKIYRNLSAKERVSKAIKALHVEPNISELYSALYTASAISSELREKVSALGVSHLIAISGYHLSLLAGFIFLLLKYPYSFFQSRYFAYRNRNRDIFIVATVLLFSYAYFLDFSASVLRAYAMMIIGYIIYDRGMKLISMQTLLVSVMLLIAFIPSLLFSLGFWLSVSGVFYIVLFMRYFEHLHVGYIFIFLHIWLYLSMLPLSLYIFSNFSEYHFLSIVLTMLFNLFYPLSILAHFLGFSTLFDNALLSLLSFNTQPFSVEVSPIFMSIYVLFSLLAMRYKGAFYLLGIIILLFFIKHMTHF